MSIQIAKAHLNFYPFKFYITIDLKPSPSQHQNLSAQYRKVFRKFFSISPFLFIIPTELYRVIFPSFSQTYMYPKRIQAFNLRAYALANSNYSPSPALIAKGKASFWSWKLQPVKLISGNITISSLLSLVQCQRDFLTLARFLFFSLKMGLIWQRRDLRCFSYFYVACICYVLIQIIYIMHNYKYSFIGLILICLLLFLARGYIMKKQVVDEDSQNQESTELLSSQKNNYQDFQNNTNIKANMQEEKKEQSSEEFGLQKKDSKDQESMADKLNMNTFKQSCLIILIASIVAFIHNTERTQPFKPYINTTSNGQISPLVYAGEVHYSRIPVQYWQHRIKMIKAMGLNALSVYIMWNYHEIEKGKFDFQTQNKNLSLFLELSEKHNMTVLIRPGPYVCAEWDFGGMPARLLSVDGLAIRSSNKLFLEQTKVYFKAVADIIRSHIKTVKNQKGCITMLQIQNEYGFVGTDKTYINALREMWEDLDIHCALYYVDWIINIRKCHWEGANIGLNDFNTQFQYDYIKAMEPRGMIFGGQIYSGWLTHWQEEKMQSQSIQHNLNQYGFLMRNNHSYSMYMVHGGTNFGLTAGANAAYRQNMGFGGHVTSYDYDAPINEQGNATEKYRQLRELIKQYAHWDVPEIPDPLPMIRVDQMELVPIASLYENIESLASEHEEQFYPFESTKLRMFNQGVVVYETQLDANKKYKVNITANDVAFLSIDGKFDQMLDRTQAQHHKNVEIECKSSSPCQLRMLIEAMGHINYDKIMQEDYKGLVQFNTSSKQSFAWKMYKLPIDEKIFEWKDLVNDAQENSTILMKTTFNLDKVGDTYFNMKNFYKGYVWVNGRNIGRYWDLGPQYKLFCPGVWLKKGENTMYVLQMKYFKEYEEFQGEKSEIKKTIKGELTLYDMNQ